MIVAAGLSFPAAAQYAGDTTQLQNRINQLENQVQTLSRAVYRGKMPENTVVTADPLSAPAPSVLSGYEDRLSLIEQQQREMTGQVETLMNDIRLVKERLDRMQADNDQRFQHMEGGGLKPPTPLDTTVIPKPYVAPSSEGTLGVLSGANDSPAEVLYEDAFSHIRDGNYAAAETGFKEFMERFSNHSLASNAQYWLGETYYVRGDYKQSARAFAQGYQDFPKGPKAGDSLLKLGLSLGKLGKKEDACLSFQQLQKEFPGDVSPVQRRAVDEIKQLGCK